MTVENHAFNKSIRETFAEATEISDQRAMEYGDTWALDRMEDGLLAITLSLPQPPRLHREFIRLVRCAAMVDIKESRMAGPWKQDSLLDQINYSAAYMQWRAAYDIAVGAPKPLAQVCDSSVMKRSRSGLMPDASSRTTHEPYGSTLTPDGPSRTDNATLPEGIYGNSRTCPGCAECAG